MASPSTENLPGPPAAHPNDAAEHPAYQNDLPPAPQNDGSPNNAPDENKNGGGKGKFWWVVAGVAVLCVLLIVVGIVPRLRAKPKLQTQSREQNQSGTPEVPITYPKRGPTATTIQLPGNMEAVQESDISARTSGYVRRWLVDLGDNVREGQILAEIDAPEVNQQEAQARAQLIQAQAGVIQQRAEEARAVASLAQSRQNAERQKAQLTQAKADLNLARVTWDRWNALVKEGAVSQQAADEKQAAYNNNLANVAGLAAAVRASVSDIAAFQASLRSAQANVGAAQAAAKASQANVARFAVLRGFENVRAPFAGVITARSIDQGALIGGGASADSGGGGASVGGGSSGGGAGDSAGGGTSGGGSQRAMYNSVSDSSSGGAGSGSDASSGGAGGGGGSATGQGGGSGTTNTSGGTSGGGGAARANAQGKGGVQGAPTGGNSSGAGAQSRLPYAGGGSSGAAGGAVISPGQSLFRIARLDILRIQVNVPQSFATVLRVGQPTRIVVKEFPHAQFRGLITRTARSLDPQTRTLLTEIQIRNQSKTLLPGMFAQVIFESQRAAPPLLIPSSALVNNAQGAQVAVVGQGDKVELRSVEVGRDYGTDLEITSGLTQTDRVIVNPSDQTQGGASVKPVMPKQENSGGVGQSGGTGQGSSGQGGGNNRDSDKSGGANGGGQSKGGGGGKGGDKGGGDKGKSGPPPNEGQQYGGAPAGMMGR